MAKSRLLLICLGLVLLSRLPGAVGDEPATPFTPWMSQPELNAYLEKLDGEKPEGKNYWDRGHWITGVEGRWEGGIPQFRISYDAVPESRYHFWYWFLDQDRGQFDKNLGELSRKGFTLAHSNSYRLPSGEERFQAVWHKAKPLTHAPPLPAGTYHLAEMKGEAPALSPVIVKIEGATLTGEGPDLTFEGSVRDRTSGAMKWSRSDGPASRGATRWEREFFELLEYGDWTEENGRLSVAQTGRTVLLFHLDQP